MSRQAVENLIQSHRSTRNFKNLDVSHEIIEKIIMSAQWAPTSHNVQAYSIITITENLLRSNLASLSGNQKYIEEAPVFLVFIADFYPHFTTCERYEVSFEVGETENIIVGAVDTALAAQNALLTARAYGLGGVMIGGIRNNSEEIAKLLNLPKWTFPVMGMCLGYPTEVLEQKPRFPRYGVLHKNRYNAKNVNDALSEYDEKMSKYYSERQVNPKQTGWMKQMADYFSFSRREKLTEFLKKQGFLKR